MISGGEWRDNTGEFYVPRRVERCYVCGAANIVDNSARPCRAAARSRISPLLALVVHAVFAANKKAQQVSFFHASCFEFSTDAPAELPDLRSEALGAILVSMARRRKLLCTAVLYGTWWFSMSINVGGARWFISRLFGNGLRRPAGTAAFSCSVCGECVRLPEL